MSKIRNTSLKNVKPTRTTRPYRNPNFMFVGLSGKACCPGQKLDLPMALTEFGPGMNKGTRLPDWIFQELPTPGGLLCDFREPGMPDL